MLAEIEQALKEAMPKHEITVKQLDSLFISVTATRGERTRYCYVYIPDYMKKDKASYIKSRVELLTGGKKSEGE